MEVKVICSIGSFDFHYVHMELGNNLSYNFKGKVDYFGPSFQKLWRCRAVCSMTCKPVFGTETFISQIVDLWSSICCYFNRHACGDMGTWALGSLFLKAAIHLSERVFDTIILLLQIKFGTLMWKKSCKTVNEAKCMCVHGSYKSVQCAHIVSYCFKNYLKLF